MLACEKVVKAFDVTLCLRVRECGLKVRDAKRREELLHLARHKLLAVVIYDANLEI